jgi:hypothetical protein
MPANPGGVVYGTTLIAMLLAAENGSQETYVKTTASIVIGLLVYWISITYSEYAGERMERGERFEYDGFVRTAAEETALLYGAAVPLLVVLVGWVVGWRLETSINIAIWTDAALIVGLEFAIGMRAGLSGRDLIRQSGFGVVLGLLVIALRVLLH